MRLYSRYQSACNFAVFLVIFCICAVTPPEAIASTAPEYPLDVAKRLQAHYDAMTSLSFSFNQKASGEMSGRQKTGNGQAYFIKSQHTSKMRWNYSSPNQQVLISDGKTFSMYFADLKQMIVTPAESMDQDLTYSFFSGQGKLDRDFYILPPNEEYGTVDPSAQDTKIIKLVPQKKQSQVQNIHIWVSQDSLIERIDLRDHFDTVTTLSFSDIAVNPLAGKDKQTTEALFSFKPPEGTEIIHQ